MVSWNISNPDLTGDDRKDIEILKRKIDEINEMMRLVVTAIRKEQGNGKDGVGE